MENNAAIKTIDNDLSCTGRRDVLKGTVSTFLLGLLPRSSSAQAQDLPLRREVHDPAAAPMLQLYKKAIGEMKSQPPWQPTSWWFWANVHWVPSDNDDKGCLLAECFNALFTATDPADADLVAKIQASRRLVAGEDMIRPEIGVGRDRIWAKCPHRTLDFLPWHRVYLYFFERTIEHVVGAPFALPYWNYLDPRFRDMPDAFRFATDSDSKPNHLYYPDRNPLCANPADPNVSDEEKPLVRDPDLNWDTAAGQTFLERGDVLGLGRGFSFQLEDGPHDPIHGRVGIVVDNGTPDGKPLGMSTPALAARDPIFYLHHGNLDRLWEWWRTQPGPPDRNPAWIWTLEPYLFVNAELKRVGRTAQESLRMVGSHYLYDSVEPVPAATSHPVVASMTPREAPRRAARSQGLEARRGPASTILSPDSARDAVPAPARRGSARWFLRLKGAAPTAAPAGVFDVYLDSLSEGSPQGKPAGSFAFFASDSKLHGDIHDGHAVATEKLIEVTTRVRELIAQGADPAKLRVTVVPTKSTGAIGARIEEFELFVQ